MINKVAPTIAVVDDHDLVREGMGKMLSLYGFNVVIMAINGKDFLMQLAKTKTIPDICILDINMPVMNGVQTAACVKTIWPQIKILAVTFDSNQTKAMMSIGADACFSKGSSSVELKQALLQLYDSRDKSN